MVACLLEWYGGFENVVIVGVVIMVRMRSGGKSGGGTRFALIPSLPEMYASGSPSLCRGGLGRA